MGTINQEYYKVKSKANRIEYVDALRGFAMFLVVYSHVWTFCYHANSKGTFASLLSNFFLVLFFFVSGFVAYKEKQELTFVSVVKMLKNKAVQLLIPTFAFSLILFCIINHNYNKLQHITLAEYWFTYCLFLFFLLYYSTIYVCKKLQGIKFDLAIICVALFFYIISFSHTTIERSQIGANIFHYLGMKNLRFFIFFCIGILIRRHFNFFKRITDNTYWMSIFILGFFFMIFYADNIDFALWKPIRMLIYGILSIFVIFSFFRKHEMSMKSDTKFGFILQYIGKRTLDIYMIHYMFLPRNLHALGKILENYSNPSLEFFLTATISLLVILISIIVGNIIRMSPLLSYYFLGDKNIKNY